MQKTYIFDTNVYGDILVEPKREQIVQNLKSRNLIIYGVDVIEKEIDDSPKDIKYKGQFFRNALLSLFESLVDDVLKVTLIAEYLANQYFKKYKELESSGRFYRIIKEKQKKYSEDDLKIDFEIIAVASLRAVDVVINADKRTMMSKLAAETYGVINRVNGLRTPRLVDYFDFVKGYKK